MMQLDLLAPRDPGPATLHASALRSTFDEVRAAIPFKQAQTSMYGKTFRVPRLECWMGLRPYTYGGQTQQPVPWPLLLHDICDDVERLIPREVYFDSCFANLYMDGQDTIGWHADDDNWIGPWIASASFGTARRFVMRRKDDRKFKHEYELGQGDVLVMPPGTQQAWEHTVPRQKRVTGARINLTFRQTVGAPLGVRGVTS